MKFKYNYLENQLSRIEEEYTYQISENNYFHNQQGTYGTDGFHLGEQEWITFTLENNQIRVIYQKGKQTYQRILKLPNSYEISFEFTQADLIHQENN